ncbi:MAG TPA: hypothetical protein VLQ93_04665, partial [Myxococcaceae bacterium]|nr:hypothetical protein [Myxococcaceae bacterium]
MSLRAVHLLLLLPGLLVGARVAAAEGDIRIRCIPEHALLGSESDVELRIELEPSATELELFVSRGEVGPLTQVEPGVYRATYVPPRQTLPQRAIIAAVARGPQGSLEGWTALSLWGQGIAEV